MTHPICRPSGPLDARMMIIGEAPGAQEDGRTPFLGAAGHELNQMLRDVELLGEAERASDRYRLDNVCFYRPPQNKIENFFLTKTEAKRRNVPEMMGLYPTEEIREGLRRLYSEIDRIRPDLILACGATPLWALKGIVKEKSSRSPSGIMAWRGSQTLADGPLSPLYYGRPYKLIPIVHPAATLRQWSLRDDQLHDLRHRVRPELKAGKRLARPDYQFTVAPSFRQTVRELHYILECLDFATKGRPVQIAADIETPLADHIACIALATSPLHAISIPFIRGDLTSYFTLPQEIVIWRLLRQILTHKNAFIIGQNWEFDRQYLMRRSLIKARCDFDTMTVHHTLFPGLPKALNYLSARYCDYHEYWKDDSRGWVDIEDAERLWTYNCRDAVVTFEVAEALQQTTEKMGMEEQVRTRMRLHEPAFNMTQRGILINPRERLALEAKLERRILHAAHWLEQVAGRNVDSTSPRPWYASPQQTGALIWRHFGVAPVLDKHTGRPTTSGKKAFDTYARREPLLKPILDKIEQYRSAATLLHNHVQIKLDPTARVSCSMNIDATETFRYATTKNPFSEGCNTQNITPELRHMYIPDPGYRLFDMDLDRADLQVVVWEAQDQQLMEALRNGADIHQLNADTIGCSRFAAKMGVHATNYGASPATLASALHISRADAHDFQSAWFAAHPGIRDWHARVAHDLATTLTVRNAFGYQRQYLDRPEALLPQALAWIPQSTVACVIDRITLNLSTNYPRTIQLLLQVHDSLVFQVRPENITPNFLHCLRTLSRITIPYPTPLIIPTHLRSSLTSWGDCTDHPWD